MKIGDMVRNFKEIAKVVGFHKKTKDVILEDASGMRWIADPGKVEKIEEEELKARREYWDEN